MFMLIIISIFLLSLFMVGCDDYEIPPSSGLDRTMSDYSFIDISSNCTLYSNISITNETSPCVGSQHETFIFVNTEFEWNIMCCDFSSACTLNEQNVSDYELLCSDSNEGTYNGYVFSDQGYWLAQCCNSNGGACYVDLYIDINNESTICDEEYHNNAYGIGYENNTWDAMCCIGGLEE